MKIAKKTQKRLPLLLIPLIVFSIIVATGSVQTKQHIAHGSLSSFECWGTGCTGGRG